MAYTAWGRWVADKPSRTSNPSRKGWGVSLIGDKEVAALLEQAKKAFAPDQIQDALLPAAFEVRDYAKSLCPVGEGKKPDGTERPHLWQLIFATKGKLASERGVGGTNEPSVIAGVDLKKAPHAHLVEFGHGGPHPAPAHPYLRPAVDACRSRIKMLAEQGLRWLLRKHNVIR